MSAVLPFPTKQFPREDVDTFRLALACILYLMNLNAENARITIETWRKCGFLKESETQALLDFYGMETGCDCGKPLVSGKNVYEADTSFPADRA